MVAQVVWDGKAVVVTSWVHCSHRGPRPSLCLVPIPTLPTTALASRHAADYGDDIMEHSGGLQGLSRVGADALLYLLQTGRRIPQLLPCCPPHILAFLNWERIPPGTQP